MIGTVPEVGRRSSPRTLGDAPAANARPETHLSGTVGNGRANHQVDVRWVKDALQHLGRYHDGPEPYGYIDREQMSILLPVPTSIFPSDAERAAQRRGGSKAFFDGFRTLFGALGLDTAAKNLRRYRSGLGGTQVYSDQEIEEHPLITEAEDKNRTRFIADTLTGRAKNEGNNRGLLGLNDGETFNLNDFWKTTKDFGSVWQKARHPDTFAAFGPFDVRSTGDLTARWKGNRLYVTGTVRHGFDEETEQEKRGSELRGDHTQREENTCNFNKGAIGSGAARDLEPLGAAKPFRMQHNRVQDLEAEPEHAPDGRLLLRSAKWGAIR